MTIDPPTSTLFRAASVVSGEEDAVPYTADVLVTNGLIAKISPGGGISAPPGARVVDAAGYYLSPGFIDMHAHSDLYLLTHADHEAKITQGCTVSERPRAAWLITRPRSSGKTVSPTHPSTPTSR